MTGTTANQQGTLAEAEEGAIFPIASTEEMDKTFTQIQEIATVDLETVRARAAEYREQAKAKAGPSQDNADFNTTRRAENFDDTVERAATILGVDVSTVRAHIDDFYLSEKHLEHVSNLDVDAAANIGDESTLTADLAEHAENASTFSNPYDGLSADQKIRLLWFFTEKLLNDDNAQKVASKFALSDADITDLATIESTTPFTSDHDEDNATSASTLAVLTYRILTSVRTAQKHLWSVKLEKALDNAVYALTVDNANTSGDTADSAEVSPLAGLAPEEKVRVLYRALSVVALPSENVDGTIRMGALKILAHFDLTEEDYDVIRQNAGNAVSETGEAVPVFSDDDSDSVRDQRGAFSTLLWDCVGVEGLKRGGTELPFSVRQDIARALLQALAILWSETGILPLPSPQSAETMRTLKVDDNRRVNKRESLYDELLRRRNEFEGNTADNDNIDDLSEADLDAMIADITGITDDDATVASGDDSAESEKGSYRFFEEN